MHSFTSILILVFIWKLDIFPLITSGSLNWPWSTKIFGQFVTPMHKFIGQSDIKHIMKSQIKTITSVLKASTNIITNIPARSIGLAEILAIMSVSTFKIAIILFTSFILIVIICQSLLIFKFKFVVLIFIHNFSSLMQFGDINEDHVNWYSTNKNS